MGDFVVTLLTGLSSAAALFLVASGLSIIFGVTRIVNFAHGSFYMLGAYVGVTTVQSVGGGAVGFWVAILIAAVAVGLIGVAMEILLLRRIYRAPELFQLIATFGVILVLQDVTLWIWGSEDLVGPRAPGFTGAVTIFGQKLPEYDLVLIAVSPLVLAGLWLLFNRTRWGTLVRAATLDRQMVSALGVNQRWLFTGVLFLGSALAGLGGAIQLPKGGADLLMDFNIIAAAFVVVVVGGMGSIGGAFLAAILIGLLQTFGIQIFPNSTLILMFLVMAVVLIFRPWGLLGKPEIPGHGVVEAPEAPLRAAGRGLRIRRRGRARLPPAVAGRAPDRPVGRRRFLAGAGHRDHRSSCCSPPPCTFIMGPGGMVSFGHAAFFGGGAYGAALLVKFAEAPMEIAFWAAPAGAALLAILFGWFCVRLTGVYFAMLTLAFAQIAWSIVFQWGDVTGGDDGILGTWPSDWASSRVAYYYLTVGFTVAGILAMRRMLFAPFGYTLRAGRDSPLRAAAIGIDLKRHQWIAFTISGAFAGLAGALFLYSKGSVFPTSMEIARSFDALLMVLLGGVHSLIGPIVGAAALTWLNDLFSELSYWRFLLGATIIGLVLLLPNGLVGFGDGWVGRRLGLVAPESGSGAGDREAPA